MTDPWFLPGYFGLIAAGWLLGRHWDDVLDWLSIHLGPEPVTSHHLELVHSNVRRLPILFDQDTDGGGAA